AHRARFVALGAVAADQTAARLRGEIRAGATRVRSVGPERGARGVDEPRVQRAERVVSQAPGLHRTRHEVRDQDVSGRHELAEGLLASRNAQVECDAALAAVARDEARAAQVVAGDRQPSRLVADPWKLDLDHRRTELAEQGGRLGSLNKEASFYDPEAVECAGRGHAARPWRRAASSRSRSGAPSSWRFTPIRLNQ